MPAQVTCPVCARPVLWNEQSRWRPFCSERCRLIDLGDWASERHVIAGETPQSSDDKVASSPRDGDDPRH